MALRGIDFHTHPLLVREMIARHPELERAARETFYIGNNFQPLESFLLELDLADLEKAVILPIDATTSRNATVYTNEQIAELCAMSPRLIGFASVDPQQPDAPDKLREAVTKLGLRGLKLAPAMQQFYADDPSVYPIYQTARELGLPLLFPIGQAARGRDEAGPARAQAGSRDAAILCRRPERVPDLPDGARARHPDSVPRRHELGTRQQAAVRPADAV